MKKSVVANAAASQVTLLDCTLRDGGYWNEWDFSTDLVERYLRSVAGAGIPVVEVGFRFPRDDRFLGPTAYTTDDYLSRIDLPEEPILGVMINAKDLQTAGQGGLPLVDELFDRSENSPISLVRIAANFPELEGVRPSIEKLHSLGYMVGLNLMKITHVEEADLEWFGNYARDSEIDVTYFADSFGSLRPDDLSNIVAGIREGYEGPLGCHLHDNMSLALANSIAAVEAGVSWVDGTILGMGRGPGNARTEYLAVELASRGATDVDVLPLLDVVTDDFEDLRNTYRWGTSIYYYLSATHGVHPTYIQTMTKDGRYTVEQIVGALGRLRSEGGFSFTDERMDGATGQAAKGRSSGAFDASGFFEGRDVLIVGPGPEGAARRRDVERYIESVNPAVIALNLVPPVEPHLVDLFVMCDPVRATIDRTLLLKTEQPVAMPFDLVGEPPPDRPGRSLDYGVATSPGTLEVKNRGCILPRLLAAGYALAFASAGGASRILLTGFDGFSTDDPRQSEMVELMELCQRATQVPELLALTKTTYPIRQRSLYGEG